PPPPPESQQGPPAVVGAAVGAETGTGRHDAVARYEELDRAVGERGAGAASRARSTRRRGHVAVGPELAVRDRARDLQDRAGEGRPREAEVDRGPERAPVAGEVALEVAGGGAERRHPRRHPQPPRELVHELARIPGGGGDHAVAGGDDREGPERRGDRRVPKGQIG